MVDFSDKYKQLPEEQRIALITKITGALEGLNLVNNPVISNYLSSAEGRMELLKKIANAKLENKERSIGSIIETIENLD